MITISDVKRACNAVLETLRKDYPELRIYGNDTTDGYVRPSFFTEIIPKPYVHETRNYISSGATFKATLFEVTHSEVFCLKMFDQIREAFGMVLKVGSRKLLVGDITYDFIGENDNMLQISVEFDWKDQKERVEPEDMMEAVEIDMRKEN